MSGEMKKLKGIPENAYRPLNEGEVYEPLMAPDQVYPEVNFRSVSLGLVMAVLFSAAAAYLGLKIGQVFEAAIPIAIIAVGLSSVFKRKNALGENVMIQSIGASSGMVVAGAIFTLPALYILGLEAEFYKVFLSSMLGGFLGILFLIPFRKYFVADMHGKYPFPEATATTEVLISGEKGGNQAKVLLISGLVGGFYDFVVATFGAWSEYFTSRAFGWGQILADKYKVVFRLNVGAAVMGLGFIVGLKYAAIICAGSFVAWYVIIPAIFHVANEVAALASVANPLASMSAEEIFRNYVRQIGIGGIAMSGMIGIYKSRSIIIGALGLAVKEIGSGKTDGSKIARTNRDLPMKIIVGGIGLTLVAVFIFFWLGVVNNLFHAVVGIIIVAVISFLFTTVAANAIAIVGTNPVSGMTLMTLIISSLVLVSVGLSGTSGMVAALLIGGVVCTALSMAGGLISDLKIGYWLGSSPYKQQAWKFVGTIVSAATVGGVIILLNKTYGFVGEHALPAPQANAMAAVIQPMMSGIPAPWLLYASGAFLALILNMIGVPALAFALGMFIPLEYNTPILTGGIISWFVTSRTKDEPLNNARREQGTLIASGFIAGGALMGVFSAFLNLFEINYVNRAWTGSSWAEFLGLFMFGLLCCYMIWHTLKAKVEEQ
jgi:putative OPT family oligopeptide transporter